MWRYQLAWRINQLAISGWQQHRSLSQHQPSQLLALWRPGINVGLIGWPSAWRKSILAMLAASANDSLRRAETGGGPILYRHLAPAALHLSRLAVLASG